MHAPSLPPKNCKRQQVCSVACADDTGNHTNQPTESKRRETIPVFSDVIGVLISVWQRKHGGA